jgi:hypothetical protein
VWQRRYGGRARQRILEFVGIRHQRIGLDDVSPRGVGSLDAHIEVFWDAKSSVGADVPSARRGALPSAHQYCGDKQHEAEQCEAIAVAHDRRLGADRSVSF